MQVHEQPPWYCYDDGDAEASVQRAKRVGIEGLEMLESYDDAGHPCAVFELWAHERSSRVAKGTLTEIGTFLDGASWALESMRA